MQRERKKRLGGVAIIVVVATFAAWRASQQLSLTVTTNANAPDVTVLAGTYNNAGVHDKAVAKVLSSALQRHPNDNIFEVNSVLLRGPHPTLNCKLTYNRSKKQMEEIGIRTGWKGHLTYSGVTDDQIHYVAVRNRSILAVISYGATATSHLKYSWWDKTRFWLRRFGF